MNLEWIYQPARGPWEVHKQGTDDLGFLLIVQSLVFGNYCSCIWRFCFAFVSHATQIKVSAVDSWATHRAAYLGPVAYAVCSSKALWSLALLSPHYSGSLYGSSTEGPPSPFHFHSLPIFSGPSVSTCSNSLLAFIACVARTHGNVGHHGDWATQKHLLCRRKKRPEAVRWTGLTSPLSASLTLLENTSNWCCWVIWSPQHQRTELFPIAMQYQLLGNTNNFL